MIRTPELVRASKSAVRGRLRAAIAVFLALAVAASPAYGASLASAATLKSFTLAPVPTISGTATVGATLTAASGTWGPAPVTLGYQWDANGAKIAGATKSTLVLSAAQVGTLVTLVVTGTKSGYTTTSKTSKATAKVGAATLTATPVPTITGTPQVGLALKAGVGTWGPSPVTLTYQWTAGGAAIAGATGSTFVPGASQIGASLGITVKGSKSGYTSVSRASAITLPVARGVLTTTPVPTITGNAKFGSVVTANAGTWAPASVSLTYQWKAAGVSIVGATSKTFTSTAAQIGKPLTITVTGSKSGYSSVAETSAATGAVSALALTATPTPTISGTAKVGAVLTVNAGTWAPATVSLGYQWKAAGLAIPRATSTSFTIGAGQAGQPITVTVTGSKSGYASVAKTSSATAAVSALTLTTTPTPTITGTAKAGSTLTVAAGTWGPAPVTLAYQWNSAGVAIVGATSPTFALSAAQGGQVITVTVTGSKTGYTSVAKTSLATAAVAVPLPVVAESGTITTDTTWGAGAVYDVSGTVTVSQGATLTLSPGVTVEFEDGAGLSVQGSLAAVGSAAAPITLTSVEAVSSPAHIVAASRWAGVSVGEYGSLTMSWVNASYGDSALTANGGSVTVSNSAFTGSTSRVSLYQTTVSITGSTFTGSGSASQPLGGIYLSNVVDPVIEHDSFTNVASPQLYVYSSTVNTGLLTPNTVVNSVGGAAAIDFQETFVDANTTLPIPGDSMVPEIVDYFEVPAGDTLTLVPGSVIKAVSASFDIDGSLVAQGTSASPIVMTSLNDQSIGGLTDLYGDTPKEGDWGGISLGIANHSTIDNVVIRYASTAIAVGQLTALEVDNTEFAYDEQAFSVGSAEGDDPSVQSLISIIQNSDETGVTACYPPYTSFVYGTGDWYGTSGMPGVSTDWTQYLGLAVGAASQIYNWITPYLNTTVATGTDTIPWSLYSCPPLGIPPFPVTPIRTNEVQTGDSVLLDEPASAPFPQWAEH